MNREWVLSNLREAAEELTQTISEIEATPDYDDGEFLVAMQHIYDHLNTAWNAREAPADRVAACSEADFFAWRQFPTDIYLGQ